MVWGKGLYNGESLEAIRLTYSDFGDTKQWELSFSKGKDFFYRIEKIYQIRWDKYKEQWEVRLDERLDKDIMFYTNADTKTFKLKNLPKSEPTEKDVLWVENGFLKIKR